MYLFHTFTTLDHSRETTRESTRSHARDFALNFRNSNCTNNYLLFLLCKFDHSIVLCFLFFKFNTVVVWIINIINFLHDLFSLLADQFLKITRTKNKCFKENQEVSNKEDLLILVRQCHFRRLKRQRSFSNTILLISLSEAPSTRISVNGRHNRRNKVVCSHLPGVEYTKPGLSIKRSKDKLLNIHPRLSYLTFADGIETLCGTLSPFTASSMKRNTKKLPSSPAVNTYLSSKLVLICRMPP